MDFKNHLEGQKSPYLLAHLSNPVDWYPWGDEALVRAKEEQKPILLSVGYSTCHWCHVMAHESFEDKDIAQVINDNFVAIKVDREERPDIDQIYMSATTAMTGQGGWPLTVFLTPQTKPFYGGTYFPPYPKWGSPGFKDLLLTISAAWANQREQILSSSEEITRALQDHSGRFDISTDLPKPSLLEKAFDGLSNQFDQHHGGFGHFPKFPMGHQILFLLRYYYRSRQAKALDMIEATLMAIAKGGIYDHVAGGFHRYSTDAQWHVPHFEKMLYDQALLIKAYLETYQLTGRLEYATVAKETLEYVLREMVHPQGGFYCAQDADSLDEESGHLREGAYYAWTEDEIKNLVGGLESEIFIYAFGVQKQGNVLHDPHGEFHGLNVLFSAHTLNDVAVHFKISEDMARQMIEKAKGTLFRARLKRPQPLRDDKVLTDWNGLMISAMAFAGAVLKDERYLEASEKCANFILSQMAPKGRILHRWREDRAEFLATLEDYSFLLNGLLDLYEVSLKGQYLEQATKLGQEMIELFQDNDKGGFYLTAKDGDSLIIRPKDIYDGAIPSGNSAALMALIRLYSLTDNPLWIETAEKTLKFFLNTIEQHPSAHTFALCSIDMYLGPIVKVSFKGLAGDSKLAEMKNLVYKHFIPNRVVRWQEGNIATKAWVCRGHTCQMPTENLGELEKQLIGADHS